MKYLYHYTTLETFLTGICVTNSIRFSALDKVNDPVDYRDIVMRSEILFKNEKEGNTYYDKFSLFKADYQNFIKKLKIVCFCKDCEKSNSFIKFDKDASGRANASKFC